MSIDGETRDRLLEMDMLATVQQLLHFLENSPNVDEWALRPWPIKYATSKEEEWPIEVKTANLIIKVERPK